MTCLAAINLNSLRIDRPGARAALRALVDRLGTANVAAIINADPQTIRYWLCAKTDRGPSRAVCAWIDAVNQLDEATLDRLLRRRVLLNEQAKTPMNPPGKQSTKRLSGE